MYLFTAWPSLTAEHAEHAEGAECFNPEIAEIAEKRIARPALRAGIALSVARSRAHSQGQSRL